MNYIVTFDGHKVYDTNDLVDAYNFCEAIYGVTEEDWEKEGISYPNGDAEFRGANGSVLKIIQEN